MSYSRYSKRGIFTNDDLGYRDRFFDDRDVEKVEQYVTSRTTYPTAEDLSEIEAIPYRWDSTSRLFRLAYEYYGNAEMWWIIAWFNKKPTEAHFRPGSTIYIPMPLSQVLYLFDRVQEV